MSDAEDRPVAPAGDENAEVGESLRAGGAMSARGRMFALTGPVALPLRGLRTAFAALTYADYRMLWAGALLSNMGSWVQNVAKSWLIYDLSRSEVWLAIDNVAQQTPALIILPLAGVLADRLDRRRTLVTVNLLMACLALVMGTLNGLGRLQVWHIVTVSGFMGFFNAISVPANQSLLPTLVGQKDLPNAVALNSMQFNLSRAVGPAIGGIVLVSLGATWSFFLNAISFAAIIFAVLKIRQEPTPVKQHASVLESFKIGFRYLRSRPDIVTIETLVFITGFCAAPVTTMMPAYVRDVLLRGPSGFSMMLSAFGLGAVTGAVLLAARAGRGPTPWRAYPVIMGFGVCQVLIGTGVPFAMVLGLVFFCGMAHVSAMNRLFAATLSSTPESVRGRIASFHMLAFVTGMPAGSLLAGKLAGVIGLPVVYTSFGFAMMAAAAVVLGIARRLEIIYRYDAHQDEV